MKTYEEETYKGESPAQRARRELADSRSALETTHRLMSEELPFLFDLKQYSRQPNRTNRGDRIEPVDSAPYDNWRHKKGIVLQKAPIYIRCEPATQTKDPMLMARVESMKHRINWHLTANRSFDYTDLRHRWIGWALAGRLGVYRWDFAPQLGGFGGEVVGRLCDPRMCFIPQGYLTPHDPLNPRFQEVFRIPINEARAMPNWKNTEKLKPDSGSEILDWIQGGGVSSSGSRVYFNAGWDERMSSLGGEGFATFCMTWYKFDFKNVKVEKTVELDFGMRFLKCSGELPDGSKCGFQSPREYEIGELMGEENYRLPASETCVRCGSTMKRQSSEEKSEEAVRNEAGKRLVITCLNGSVEDEMYDGPWPAPECPTYPYAWLCAEIEPHRAIPESDVSIGWNMTVGRNFTMQTIYEQAHRSKSVKLFPRKGIEDRNGMAPGWDDDLADVLFYTSDFPPDGVKEIPGQEVGAALFQLYDLLHGVSKENEGSSRISLGPDQSKDIPVGTLQQMIDSGNVPINTFIKSLYAAESIAFTNLVCYIRKFDTQKRWIRFRGKDGQLGFELMRGIDLPDVDVVCSAGPELSNIKPEAVTAWQTLAAMTPGMRRGFGRAQGIDESLLDEMDEAQRMDAPQVPAAAPDSEGSGVPAPPPPQEAMV